MAQKIFSKESVRMKVEGRNTFGERSLILLPENEEESELIDQFLSSKIPTKVVGEIELDCGYGQHYIELKVEDANRSE